MMGTRKEADIRDQRRNGASTQNRSNEYFVPKDGIDREVITADICRYLGNDALVRPGTYENPITKKSEQGYFVTAYRNLTSAMIQDLKADSARWEQERRVANSRANGYKQSQTHESRQQYGPSGESDSHYPPSVNFQPGYDQIPKAPYPQSSLGSYVQPSQRVPPYMQLENHYIAGSNMGIEQSRGFPQPIHTETPRVSAPQYVQVSPSQQFPSQAPIQNYGRGTYGQPPPPLTNPHRSRDDPSFTAPIINPPFAFQEEKKAYYAQPTTCPSYGVSYGSRDAYSDRSYPDPESYNHTAMVPPAARPPQNNTRTAVRDRNADFRDNWIHRDPSHRH